MKSLWRELVTDQVWRHKYLCYSAKLQADLDEENKIYDAIPLTDKTRPLSPPPYQVRIRLSNPPSYQSCTQTV